MILTTLLLYGLNVMMTALDMTQSITDEAGRIKVLRSWILHLLGTLYQVGPSRGLCVSSLVQRKQAISVEKRQILLDTPKVVLKYGDKLCWMKEFLR